MNRTIDTRSQSGRSRIRAVGSLLLFLILLGATPSAVAQSDAGRNRSDAEARGLRLKLPAGLPDGRPLRPIAFYKSQMAELVPRHYWPVSLERFSEAITALVDRSTDDQASRLKTAVYWVEIVGDTLVSDRSVIDIESDRETLVRRSLGKVNLVLEPAEARAAVGENVPLPRLETDASGKLLAVFRGDAEIGGGIEFKWRLRGQVSGTGHEFLMQLPRTPQTRIVLSAPPELTIHAIDGVLRSRPGPPPDAGAIVRERELRWYELDAGGLTNVRLRTSQRQAASEPGKFVIRRSSLQYDADPSGLAWNCRMVVQAYGENSFPVLAVSGTTITAVRINSNDVPFSSETIGARVKHLQIEAPTNQRTSDADVIDVTVMGHSTWSGKNGWCDLPMPVWIGESIHYASAVDDVQLAVSDPLQVMNWELPPAWKQSREQRIDDAITLFSADGPSVATVNGANAAMTSPLGAGAWSRVRLIERPLLKTGRTALRMDVTEGLLRANARISIDVDRDLLEPIHVRVEPGWNLDSVVFEQSGRVVEQPSLVENTRVFVLWPEVEDAGESQISFTVSGTRLLAEDSSGLVVPPTWFVRPLGVRADLVAAIVAPEDRNWSGEASMERGRVSADELSEQQREFFTGITEGALWFLPRNGRTPAVRLETPSISYIARTLLDLSRDGDDVIEQLLVEIDAPGQALKQLAVDTGPAAGRPQLSWSISGGSDSISIGLPSTKVTLGTGADQEIYTIDVADQNLRGRRLIARRRYPINQPIELQLPSVPGAASQVSEVMVSPGLSVQQESTAVQRVPNVAQSDGNPAAVQSSFGSDDEAATTPPGVIKATHTRLRYDAVEQPAITISRTDVDPNVTIVWREQIRVIASSRGTDTIEAIYKVTPTGLLEIEYDPELQLSSIWRDGISIDLSSVPQRPTVILQPRSRTEVIRVVWDRSHYGSSWMRRCRIPRITVSGTVLKSEYRLVPSTDAFAPAALMRGASGSTGEGSSVAMRPGENATLVRRNIALAMGWLSALAIFAFCWFVGERSPIGVLAVVVILATILLLWWPWRTAVTGWLIIPAVAAGMLACSRAWGIPGIRAADKLEPPEADSAIVELSNDFSLESMARFMGLLACLALAATAVVTAQESVTPPATPGADSRIVDLLVPVDRDGNLSGEMVYIPESLRAELFGKRNPSEPLEPRFQSAEYQVRIDPDSTGDDPRVTVEAEFLLHVDGDNRSTNLVRLPLDSTTVRRIEMIDDISQIKQFTADASGQVIASLPAGESFRLRATLMPPVAVSESWSKIRLRIPLVAATRLRIDADQTIDTLRVGGAAGRLLGNADLGRWLPEPGPTDVLEIDYRTLSQVDATRGQPLQRRYWVHAGKKQVTIDCEINPPPVTAIGESFQFVVRDSAMPIVTSSGWRLGGTELYNSTRRLITVASTRQSPGPLRLLWTQPLEPETGPDGQTANIQVPEVIAAALGENAPAWVALHCDSALQFESLDRENVEPLSVDHFLAAWSGYRGRIDRAHVVLGEIPALVIKNRLGSQPLVVQDHHLHVASNRLEIEFEATLTPSDLQLRRYALRLPRGLQLTRVTVNDQPLVRRPIRSGSANEIPLGSFVGPESVIVRVVAAQELESSSRFSPPRLSVLPAITTSDTYHISRDRATQVAVVEEPLLQSTAERSVTMTESLAEGRIPYASWAFSTSQQSDGTEMPGGIFEVKPRQTRFNCDQLITVNRREGRWTMETLIRFQSRRLPDFIDLEIPTAWCDSLQVSPADAWTQQPAMDPSRQIIRVRCDAKQIKNRVLSIRGALQDSDSGRVSVPSVRVLGAGSRQTHINVPARLNTEPIQWRTSAVEAVRFPQSWREDAVDRNELTYLVANPSWSIDLAPLPEIDTEAVAVMCDAQVFAQSSGALVMCHWDLLPGGLESVRVRLPPGATWLGAWSAGKAVVPEAESSAGDDSAAPQAVLRIPLSLSRLSQPVDLLVRVPATTAKQAKYLPELLGIPVTQAWLANYVSADQAWESAGRNRAEVMHDDRAVALARSVVEAVEGLELVAQRPREEVAAWLSIWLARYRMLSASAGHMANLRPDDDDAGNSDEAATFRTPLDAAESLSAPTHQQWRELDARMAVYVRRHMADDQATSIDDSREFVFRVARFDGFVVQNVTRLSASNRPPSVQPESSNDWGLRKLVVNSLTLLLVCGLLLSLRPLQSFVVPVVIHPAFWLALMGLFGLAVAPIPVAAAIMMVAVTLFVLPSRRSAPGSVG